MLKRRFLCSLHLMVGFHNGKQTEKTALLEVNAVNTRILEKQKVCDEIRISTISLQVNQFRGIKQF